MSQNLCGLHVRIHSFKTCPTFYLFSVIFFLAHGVHAKKSEQLLRKWFWEGLDNSFSPAFLLPCRLSGDCHYTCDPDKSIPLVQPKRPHKTRDQRRDDNKTRDQRRDDNKTRDQRRDDNKRGPRHLNKSVCENVWRTTRSQATLFV